VASEQTISSLRAGDEVRGVYACVRKDRLKTRTGSAYLALELRDRTGSVQARAFRDADQLAGRFERGDLVTVAGRVERFRDDLVVEVTDIRRAQQGGGAGDGDEVAVESFLPVAYRDMDELDGFLEHLASEVYDPGYRALLDALLADAELRGAFRRTPCTRNGHHAYLGGLLEHTVAVASMALELCTLHPRLDRDLLLSAALVHDLGKTREFTYSAEIAHSEEGRLLGHVELGLRLIARYAPQTLAAEHKLALEHCVMLHHGADAAAGRRFASPEALALHRLNALDAQVKGAFEHGLAR
jgi:3'-5' exoribonuclease